MTDAFLPGQRVDVQIARNKVITCRVEKRTFCKYCGRDMYWATTPKEQPMPLDPPDAEGKVLSHWATCPKAPQARADAAAKRRAAGGAP